MIALCVEDEPLLLENLVRAVEQSPDIERAVGFEDEEEALSWAAENTVDIAFLDMMLHGQSGLRVAERLREKSPLLPVIFCTGHPQYALDALKIHADGYLIKPVAPEDVQRELDHLKLEGKAGQALLTVRCWGGFSVRDRNGAQVIFRRSRSPELLALLIDAGGRPLTVDEMCDRMWADNQTMLGKNRNYVRQLLLDLRVTLESVGADQVIGHSGDGYYADLGLIRLDGVNGEDMPYLPTFAWAAGKKKTE